MKVFFVLLIFAVISPSLAENSTCVEKRFPQFDSCKVCGVELKPCRSWEPFGCKPCPNGTTKVEDRTPKAPLPTAAPTTTTSTPRPIKVELSFWTIENIVYIGVAFVAVVLFILGIINYKTLVKILSELPGCPICVAVGRICQEVKNNLISIF